MNLPSLPLTISPSLNASWPPMNTYSIPSGFFSSEKVAPSMMVSGSKIVISASQPISILPFANVSIFNKELAEKYYDNKYIDYHIEFFRAGLNAVIKK